MLADLADTFILTAEAQAMGTFFACSTVTGSTAEVVVARTGGKAEAGVLLIRRGSLSLPRRRVIVPLAQSSLRVLMCRPVLVREVMSLHNLKGRRELLQLMMMKS